MRPAATQIKLIYKFLERSLLAAILANFSPETLTPLPLLLPPPTKLNILPLEPLQKSSEAKS